MKIGIVVPGFSADESDWCIPALRDLVRALARSHAVHVFALRYPHARGCRMVYGARVHRLGGGQAAGLGRLPLLTRSLREVVRESRRERFDVLHGFWADEPGFLAASAGHLVNTPAVVSVAGGELVRFRDIGYGGQLSRMNRWMTERCLRAADRVTVGSRQIGLTVERLGYEKPLLLPLGVDTDRFAPAGDGRPITNGPRLLHVGSLTLVKDQATLLQAFAQVTARHPGAKLEIAGEGPQRGSLEALGTELGVSGRTRFLGPVAHERLPGLYRGAHLLVVSSRHESQSLAALEAAACGTPVVGTAVGVVPELAPRSLTAPVGDAEALASVVERVLDDEVTRRRLGATQRRIVARRFALERTVARLTSLYDSLARAKPGALPSQTPSRERAAGRRSSRPGSRTRGSEG